MRQRIEKYGYNLWSGDFSISGYLGCYNENYVQIAQIAFYNEGFDVPGNSKTGNLINLNFPISKFNYVIDLLRNEDPVYISYNETNKLGVISSAKEEVGEGE
jgi:hypothetical protein